MSLYNIRVVNSLAVTECFTVSEQSCSQSASSWQKLAALDHVPVLLTLGQIAWMWKWRVSGQVFCSCRSEAVEQPSSWSATSWH